jgi:CheY-like chemotaxis protein
MNLAGVSVVVAKIAIVDDSTDTVEILGVLIRQDGHTAVHFSDGKSFLEAFRQQAFDLILLDIAMPEVSGYDVLQAVRAIDADVPVFAVTANVFESDRKRAEAAGFSAFVAKPIFNFEEFTAQISHHVRTYHKTKGA